MLPAARDAGVGLMLENLPGDLSTVAELAKLLEPIPELGLHLDIGHANLASRGTPPRKSSPRSPLACAMFIARQQGWIGGPAPAARDRHDGCCARGEGAESERL